MPVTVPAEMGQWDLSSPPASGRHPGGGVVTPFTCLWGQDQEALLGWGLGPQAAPLAGRRPWPPGHSS